MVSPLKPQKEAEDSFSFVCFCLLVLILLSQTFPALCKSSSASSAFSHILFSSPSTAQPLASFFFFYSCSPCSVTKWQLWESTAACWCHVNQIRCHNRKSAHMRGRGVVTHAHDLQPLQAKCSARRHRYTDMNLLWVKGNRALSQTASYLLQHIWRDIQSAAPFCSDGRRWFRENSAPSFEFICTICWLFSRQKGW